MLDKILQKIGLSYEDLNSVERETLDTWMDSLKKNKVTVASTREYISKMKDSVEQDLTKTDLNSKQDLFLKARLRNYMLLEAFLLSPERAQKAIEGAVAGMIPKK